MKRLLFAKANNLVVILLSVMLGATLATNWARPNNSYAVDPQTTTAEQKATLKQVEDGFTGIAEKVEPVVDRIQARAQELGKRLPGQKTPAPAPVKKATAAAKTTD